jgi:drug/metabolite transporter (DMT)-like permease
VSVIFALLSALCYGTGDFVGGVMSTRIPAWTAAFCSQVGGAVATLILAFITAGEITASSLAWGAASGVGTGVGLVALYHGLAVGRMGVVAPLSGIVGAIVPAVTGLLTGDDPSALIWVGLLLALPAVALVASTPSATEGGNENRRGSGAIYGIIAGAAFGIGFATIAQVPESAGHWPVALSMAVGALVTTLIATVLRESWRPTRLFDWTAALGGVLGASAVVFFLEAAQRGLLSVASVLSALYPAVTVVLAVLFLRERIHRTQAIGLVLTGVAVALVAAG